MPGDRHGNQPGRHHENEAHHSLDGRRTLSSARVPIAGVLNEDSPSSHAAISRHLISGVHSASPSAPAEPFSGRLKDVLLDPSKDQWSEPKKLVIDVETDPATTAITSGSTSDTPPALAKGNMITLPRPSLPHKAARKHKIPPLLPGIDCPPPLPPVPLPPITGEGGEFGRVGGGTRNTIDSSISQDRAGESSAQAAPSVALHDVQGRNQSSDQHVNEESHDTGKRTRRARTKWTNQETEALRAGVRKFGVGGWKEILAWKEVQFDPKRTPTDLKDRWRVICPGEGLKAKKTIRKGIVPQPGAPATAMQPVSTQPVNTPPVSLEERLHHIASQPQAPPAPPLLTEERPTWTTREDETLRETTSPPRDATTNHGAVGTEGPYFKKQRRDRVNFTEEDDINLMKGYEKYGTSWSLIRDDKELNLSTRHAIDLRDRFRNRYQQHYWQAGLKMRDGATTKGEGLGSHQERGNSTANRQPPTSVPGPRGWVATSGTSLTNDHLTGLRLRQPLSNSFPGPLEDYQDNFLDEGVRSPITLSRRILDRTPNSGAASAGTNAHASTTVSADNLFPSALDEDANPAYGTEGMYALRPHSTGDAYHVASHNTSNVPSIHTITNPLLIPVPGPNLAELISSTLSSTPPTRSIPSSSSAIHSHHPTNTNTHSNLADIFATPNLPNMVIPPVPASSARNQVHNLPKPSSLFSNVHAKSTRADFQPSTRDPTGHAASGIIQVPSVSDHQYDLSGTEQGFPGFAMPGGPGGGGSAKSRAGMAPSMLPPVRNEYAYGPQAQLQAPLRNDGSRGAGSNGGPDQGVLHTLPGYASFSHAAMDSMLND